MPGNTSRRNGFTGFIHSTLVLRILRFAGDERKTLNDLRAKLGVTSGTLRALVDGLEREALVARVPHPTDRRAIILELTEKGRTVADSVVASIQRFFEMMFRNFTEDEKKLLNDLLDKLCENAVSAVAE